MATIDTVLLSDLWATVESCEGRLAYGSETAMLGDFWAAIRRLVDVPKDPGLYDTVQVPKDEADWWIAAYEALEAEPSRDTQDIYDALA